MAFQKAIDHNQKAQIKTNMARVHLDLALTLKNMGQSAKAKPHFQKAAEALKKKLVHDLDSPETLVRLGVALAELGRLSDATDYLQQAVDKNPSDFQSQLTLARILVKQKRYDEAVTVLKKAIEAAPGRHALNELQIYLQLVKNKAKY
jgi:tetratricopeptide (TPR) repeat protein